MRIHSQPRIGRYDRQGDASEKECRHERRTFCAGLAALSEQGASTLEVQRCALMWVRMRMQCLGAKIWQHGVHDVVDTL